MNKHAYGSTRMQIWSRNSAKAEFVTSYDTARVRLKKKTFAIGNLERNKRIELTHGALLSVITEQKLNSNNL